MESAKLNLAMLKQAGERSRRLAKALTEALDRGESDDVRRLQAELADLHDLSDRYASELLVHFDKLAKARKPPGRGAGQSN